MFMFHSVSENPVDKYDGYALLSQPNSAGPYMLIFLGLSVIVSAGIILIYREAVKGGKANKLKIVLIIGLMIALPSVASKFFWNVGVEKYGNSPYERWSLETEEALEYQVSYGEIQFFELFKKSREEGEQKVNLSCDLTEDGMYTYRYVLMEDLRAKYVEESVKDCLLSDLEEFEIKLFKMDDEERKAAYRKLRRLM